MHMYVRRYENKAIPSEDSVAKLVTLREQLGDSIGIHSALFPAICLRAQVLCKPAPQRHAAWLAEDR